MNHVGQRIKSLVKIWAIIGLSGCAILLIIGAFMYFPNSDNLKYASVNGGGYGYARLQKSGDEAYMGQQMMTTAASAAAAIGFGALVFYGFGVLVAESERQTELLTDLLAEQRKANRENLPPELPKYQEPRNAQTPEPRVKESTEAHEERKPRTRRAKAEGMTLFCPMCSTHFEGEASDILPGRKLCMVCDGMVRQFINQTANEEKQQAKEYLQTCMQLSQDSLICDSIKILLEKNKT